MAKKKLTYDTASKIVPETFLAEINSMVDHDLIKSKLVDAQVELRANLDSENEDSQLAAARELAKDLGAGYKEVAKQKQAQIVVCLNRLEELGGV